MPSNLKRLRQLLKMAVNKAWTEHEKNNSETTSVKVFLENGQHIDVEFRFFTAVVSLASISRNGQKYWYASFDADLHYALSGDTFLEDDETQINMLVLQLEEKANK